MRLTAAVLASALVFFGAAYAQSDRGTITGTIADPAGAMIPDVSIEAKNTQTGAIYQTISSATGNYTLAQLPVGIYQITASLSGFKQFVRTGITVMVAQTLRIDIAMEVGNISETVTVIADAPLLKTESGELSHNVTSDRLDSLPILNAALGIRSAYATVDLLPGAGRTQGGFGTLRVNGMPGATLALRIEGQDATQTAWTTAYTMSQPGVDSIEETAVQTSNFSAEFGQAGGGVFNMTMRSGTNRFHGSAYEYMVNEAFNASSPFYSAGTEKPKSVQRRHDFGFTAGGPVYIPSVYDGRDKTFFFWSFEQNRQNTVTTGRITTVPTDAFRSGDFSSVYSGDSLGADVLGRNIPEGQLYDPDTTETVNVGGSDYVVRQPFTNNQIDPSRFDPVAARFQELIPHANLPGDTNNYLIPPYRNEPLTSIHSIKMDHNISPKIKISGYWSLNDSRAFFPDGFEPPITTERDLYETTHTVRLSLDYTVGPTQLLHLGAGIMRFVFTDDVPNINYDNFANLGLPGTLVTRPPTFNSLGSAQGGLGSTSGQGNSAGPIAQQNQWSDKPTGTASFSWIRNNHTFKFGGEVRVESFPSYTTTPANGWFTFSPLQTSLPYLAAGGLLPFGRYMGNSYASFLLGQVDRGEIGQPSKFHMGKHALAFFV